MTSERQRPLWEYSSDEFPNAGSDVAERFEDWPRLRDNIRGHLAASGSERSVEFEDWPGLRDNIRDYLGPLNVIYSWWWCDPEFEPWITGGDDEDRGATFHVTVAMAYRTVVWWCPINRADEPEVRQVLGECASWLAYRWAPEVIGSPP